ncbi:MAG: HAD-IC family P-type ATPase [Methylotenera sp.]|nr:HAD-IC family P-type ATPase [Oligoflexia bacterium]
MPEPGNELGLSESEVRARLIKFGPNELPSSQPKSRIEILMRVAKEPMVVLLLVCGLLYLILGKPEEGIPLFASILFVVGIGFFQQAKSERALEALRDLASPRALVVRSGHEKRIAGSEVVPDDILIVREGDRVAADCTLLEAQHLRVDESLLTGESLPVEKRVGVGEQGTLLSGSMIVTGRALAKVTKTGSLTQMGRIGETLKIKQDEPSQLEAEVGSIVKRFGALGLCISLLIAVSYGLIYRHWAPGFGATPF